MRHRHAESAAVLDRVHPARRQSAANLLDYLTLRRHDIRRLQESLAELGLSSLGRAEEHVLTSLERVLATLHLLGGDEDERRTESAVGFGEGRLTLERNAEALLGPSPAGRPTRMLVTMPSHAAQDGQFVRGLIDRGMDCARINCAHDSEPQWMGMVENVRRAADGAGRGCPIFMDIPGPKLRTGAIEPGPRVVRLRPPRDSWGRPTSPAVALLVAEDPTGAVPAASGGGLPMIPVPERWLSIVEPGDQIRLRDTRDSSRTMEVADVGPGQARVEVHDTTYLATGTRLTVARRTCEIGLLPPIQQAIVLRPGDTLTLTADQTPSPPDGRRIGCTLPEALDAVAVGHRVFFDDGRIGGEVVGLHSGSVDIRVTQAAEAGSKLRCGKGINLPDDELRLPALGSEDLDILRFIVGHADLVGLSFAQRSTDVRRLQRELGALGGERLGIVLKVETASGFQNLPEMLLEAMASERVGVMIARGDLAVECGFERLAEVQEEMLWLCDAAHVPVIWATEVLDQMARTGQPSRAEISDAAMAGRAECVMLNKGPHIDAAVSALDDILRRMSSHQRKKVTLLRRLRSWYPDPE